MKPGPLPETAEGETLAVSARGDGRHRVLKIRRADRTVVVKCYGRKTGRLRSRLRQFGSRFLVGKSSTTPRGRRRTEAEVIALWRRERFDVPEILPDEPPPGIDAPYLVLEWIEGPPLAVSIRPAGEPSDRAHALVRALAETTARRHARALAEREPRLLFEHPTLEHILVSGDRLVHIDFEIVFRRRRSIDRIARRELTGFLHSMAKNSGDRFPALLEEFVAAYPDRDRLERLLADLRRYRAVPVAPWLGAVQRLTRLGRRYEKRSVLVASLARVLDGEASPPLARSGAGRVAR